MQVEVKVLTLMVEIDGIEKTFRRGDIIDIPKAKAKQLGLSVAKYVPPIVEDEEDEDEGGAPAPTLKAAPHDTGKGGGEPPGKKGK